MDEEYFGRKIEDDEVFFYIFPFETEDGCRNKIEQLKYLAVTIESECESELIKGLHSMFPELSTLKHYLPHPGCYSFCEHYLKSVSSFIPVEWGFKKWSPDYYQYRNEMETPQNVERFFKFTDPCRQFPVPSFF